MTSSSRRLVAAGIVVALATVLAACSSAGGNPAAPAPSAAIAGTPDTVGTPNSASGTSNVLGQGPGGPLDVTKLCAAVPLADVQKLVKATVGPADPAAALLGECLWAGGVEADIYRDDTDKRYYNTGVPDGTPVSGVGDTAQWSAAVPLATVPSLAAQKGSTTVTITVDGDAPDTTLTYSTGSFGSYKIDPASNAHYVTEQGQICNDIFAAAG